MPGTKVSPGCQSKQSPQYRVPTSGLEVALEFQEECSVSPRSQDQQEAEKRPEYSKMAERVSCRALSAGQIGSLERWFYPYPSATSNMG